MLLEMKEVDSSYVKRPVLKKLSINVDQGEMIALLGHNGAGKTTALRNMFGLHKPSSGQIHFNDEDVTNMSPNKHVLKGMAFVPQGHNVFPTLTVRENLKLGCYHVKNSKAIEDLIEEVYELFPILKERQKQLAGTMSGGQQQMLALGIALMSKPKILLLDEPSTGLAPVLVERVLEVVQKINKEKGMSIILVEQNVKDALKVTDRVYVLKRGEVIYEGSSRDLEKEESLWHLF